MGDQGVHVIDLIRWSFGEFTRVVVNAGVAYPARSAPGVNRPADTDDYCTVLAELVSGAEVTFAVSRVAHATNEQSLEVWGTDGALRHRLVREGAALVRGRALRQPRRSRLRAGGAARDTAGQGRRGRCDRAHRQGADRALVASLLDGIRTGRTPSPSFHDGLRAQAVLDAALESSRRGAWVAVEA